MKKTPTQEPKITYTFVSLEKGADKRKPCDTYKEAFTQMHEWVDKAMKANQLSFQVLETAIWIEIQMDDVVKAPLYFYDARDIAYDEGIMADGKLVA